jgi:hypothetical protein
MSECLVSAQTSLLLCDLVDLLRKQHRAGITPSFGQVDELFELSDRLRLEASVDPVDVRRRCSVPGCDTPVMDVAIVAGSGKPYCAPHASALRLALATADRLMPGVVDVRMVRTDWPIAANRVTGIDPRD